MTTKDLCPKDLSSIGATLKFIREDVLLTQADLALATGLDRKTVNRIERGLHSPRISTLASILQALSSADPSTYSNLTLATFFSAVESNNVRYFSKWVSA